jgi:ATP-dependent DNA helicase RecQ
MADVLQTHLETMLGPGATFRDGQRASIEAVVQDGSRTLIVQRTGWGKSLVYWIATRVRRDAGHGPTIIVSPLLSLMRNQIQMADRLGLRAVTLNSANRDDWAVIEADLAADRVDVLFVSAQRFANEDFTTRVLPSIAGSIGMFVVDEAHCISDWGHEFVPDYRRISRLLPALGPVVPVVGTTATANDRVVADVAAQLGEHVRVVRGPLARASLHLDAITLDDQAERLAWLAAYIPGMPGSGIVYCLTVADTERVAAWLRANGINAAAYNAAVDPVVRERLEQELLGNRLKVLVATIALGMGFDKPDLGFVVHFQRPGSPIGYYQQVGRAGRGVADAYGVLLSGREDDEIAEYFISTAFPPAARMQEVLAALEGVETATLRDILAHVNLPMGQVDKALKLLEVDGAVGRERGRFFRTPMRWTQDEAWIAGVLEARRAELDSMREYVDTGECRMAFLARLLDDPTAHDCGHCSNDGGRVWPREVDHDLVLAAIGFLRGDARVITPRKQHANGSKLGSICEEGRALCVYGDAGWGRRVQGGRQSAGRFDDEAVAAAVALIRDRWRPAPAPTWVTAIPSAAHRTLVGDAAQRIATLLGLPYVECLTAALGLPPQADMENSWQQESNARAKLSVHGELVRSGPVLLIDDIVDSKWTISVAGELLRSHGSGPVHPFAFAVTSSRGA